MNIIIDNYRISIDAAATREYYRTYGSVNDCDCSGCRNFRKYVPRFSGKIQDFFRNCGIDDMKMIAEIIPIFTEPDGLIYYGGFYHIVGNIIDGNVISMNIPCYKPVNDALGNVTGTVKTGEKLKTHTESGIMKIGDSFSIYFSDMCGLLPEKFPPNAVQLEIETKIPWVIEDENDY